MIAIGIKTKIKPEIFFLIAIILFFIITNIIWLAIDTLPPSWDDSIHMKLTLQYSRLLPQMRSVEDLKEILSLSSYYPPFFHISATPMIYLFGFNEDWLVYINFLYLIILVFSVYGIGRILFNSRAGIFSAALTLLYPAVYALSRRYMLDFALASMVSLVYYLIVRYDKEQNITEAVLLFLTMIAATLVKQTAIIFFIPVVILLFITRWLRKKYIWPIACSAIISTFLIAMRHFDTIIKLFSYKGQFDVISVMWRLKDHLLFYLNALRFQIISPMLLIFFVIGLSLLLFLDRRRLPLFILLVWILGSLFILSLIKWKDGRYLMAALPAFAIITAGGINVIPSRPLKGILLSALIPIGFIQFFNLSFNLPPFLVKESDYFYNSRPLQHDWKVKEILEYMQSRYKNREIKIGLFPNCEHFNHDEFILYIALNKLPYSIEQLFASKIFAKAIKDCKVVLTKYPFSSIYCSDDKGEAEFYENSIRETLRKSRFKNIADFDLPDNSKAMIYEMEPESH